MVSTLLRTSRDLETEEKADLEQRLLGNEIKVLSTLDLGWGSTSPTSDSSCTSNDQAPSSRTTSRSAAQDVLWMMRWPSCLMAAKTTRSTTTSSRVRSLGLRRCVTFSKIVEENPGIRMRGIEAQINLKTGRLNQSLKFLEVDQAIYRERGAYYRTPTEWAPELERWEEVTRRRRHELDRMRAFATSADCLMRLVMLTSLTIPMQRVAADVRIAPAR